MVNDPFVDTELWSEDTDRIVSIYTTEVRHH